MVRLLRTAPWVDRNLPEMYFRGNVLRRTKFFLVESKERDPTKIPENLRRYRYPGWQWKSMLHYRSINSNADVKELVRKCSKLNYILGDDEKKKVVLNHVIGTEYKDGHDDIGWHEDRPVDIEPGGLIVDLSFGATRELHLREKETKIVKIVIPLKSGDLFILGPKTNATMEHSIVETEKDVGPRISLVMRDICTVVSLEKVQKMISALERKNSKQVDEEPEELEEVEQIESDEPEQSKEPEEPFEPEELAEIAQQLEPEANEPEKLPLSKRRKKIAIEESEEGSASAQESPNSSPTKKQKRTISNLDVERDVQVIGEVMKMLVGEKKNDLASISLLSSMTWLVLPKLGRLWVGKFIILGRSTKLKTNNFSILL